VSDSFFGRRIAYLSNFAVKFLNFSKRLCNLYLILGFYVT